MRTRQQRFASDLLMHAPFQRGFEDVPAVQALAKILLPRLGLGACPPLPLESNVPGVFAVGDARSGSVKRVGGAIGEGAAVVAQLHSYVAASRLQQAAQSST
jgi:hypothetical protein